MFWKTSDNGHAAHATILQYPQTAPLQGLHREDLNHREYRGPQIIPSHNSHHSRILMHRIPSKYSGLIWTQSVVRFLLTPWLGWLDGLLAGHSSKPKCSIDCWFELFCLFWTHNPDMLSWTLHMFFNRSRSSARYSKISCAKKSETWHIFLAEIAKHKS